ncbi:TonB-linked outer membrane protein, SusC/RagA family [Chitinophaga sp. CF118]|uniref:SusC/RagA family TonB-linked outer membrane protein n=1 Tax=Chitinophaga sp. CF118 TaxID=1884367 RepID=UPI0008F2DFAE|nr:SusC/RagA family TonB-linked outer membrane protein [Chitinophaga sp. CF118]SFE44983.1 TonB-linked outer membrane protein, SusC/RagA family [Chitinophaga sp. CF118]
MRLSIWLFISLLYLQLPVYSITFRQIEPKVSISGTYTLQKIFQKIEQQTGKRIFYANSILNDQEKINLKVTNHTINEVLTQILTGKKLEWSIEPKFITIVEIRNQPSPKSAMTGTDTTISVTGRVTNEKGEPIVGATVLVKGTRTGATTNAEGEFIVRDVRPNSYLSISSVQYLTKEVAVKGKTVIGSVQLEEYVGNLDETVVIAYGTTSKRLSTGDVSSVKAKDIETQPVNNPLLALSGRVPGLFVTQSNGMPGSGVIVRIQGQNSISRGNDPFYVIDGVPYNAQMLPSLIDILGTSGGNYAGGGASNGNGNPLSFINPSDIESIDVLKDADATAIYGSRAANGAILITTKKGKSGQTRVDVIMQRGVGQVTRRMNLLNTKEYLEMRKEAYRNDGLDIPNYSTPVDEKNVLNYDLTVYDTTRNTNWQKELFGRKSHYSDVQASVSGGNALTTFRLNGGYHSETTVFPGKFSDTKGSLGISINHSSENNKFRMQFSGNYLTDDNHLPTSDITTTALQLVPDAPALYNADGTLNWARISSGTDSISTWLDVNPLAYLSSKYQIRTDNLLGNALLSYSILPGLDIKTSLGYTNIVTSEISTFPLTLFSPENRQYNSRSASYGDGKSRSWIVEPQITYNFKLGNGSFNILLGTTFQENKSYLKRIDGLGYASDEVLEDFRAASTLTSGTSVQNTYKYAALFTRINYNYQDKYILNLTARRDGSSRFGIENQFHDFGAVGVAWIFSNEPFIKNNINFLSFGKLRGSYGTTGNDQIGDYQFLNLYELVSRGNPYQGFTGLKPNGLPNPYLQWELTRKIQAGLDLGFLQQRILLQANFYRNRSSNQLLSNALPYTSGFGDLVTNLPATIQNSGLEVSLSTINIKGVAFSWSTNLNITISKNKLISFPNLSTSSSANFLIIGQPLGIEKIFSLAGVNSQTGLYQFHAADGTLVSSPDDVKDRIDLFKSAPKLYGGIQNTFNYKGFQLGFVFQFVKQNARNYSLGLINRVGRGTSNQPTSVLNRWQEPGDNSNIAKFSTTKNISVAQGSNASYGDASYIRLKNLSFSWQLPQNWNHTIHLQSCRLFIQGQNLLTFTKYIGLDPESQGLGLPPLKIWTLGLHVSL